MEKVLFNRNDPKVIAFAQNCKTVEEFVREYSNTTGTEKTLTQAYYDIKYSNKMSVIRAMSGATKNEEPIEPIIPTKKTIMAKKAEVTTTTTIVEGDPTKTRYEFHDGEIIPVTGDPVPEVEKKPKKQKTEKSVKQEKTQGPTKQDRIRELLRGGATNKEVKTILGEEGVKVYDSEIASARSKNNAEHAE